MSSAAAARVQWKRRARAHVDVRPVVQMALDVRAQSVMPAAVWRTANGRRRPATVVSQCRSRRPCRFAGHSPVAPPSRASECTSVARPVIYTRAYIQYNNCPSVLARYFQKKNRFVAGPKNHCRGAYIRPVVFNNNNNNNSPVDASPPCVCRYSTAPDNATRVVRALNARHGRLVPVFRINNRPRTSLGHRSNVKPAPSFLVYFVVIHWVPVESLFLFFVRRLEKRHFPIPAPRCAVQTCCPGPSSIHARATSIIAPSGRR